MDANTFFKNMKHANIECPECNWKWKQRKKQEKHYRNHKTSCYIKFPESPLTVLDESRAEYNCTNCGCVFPLKMKHAEIECPVCEKLKKDCKKVYYDEWHDEYVCKKCGLVIKHL